MNWAYPGQGIVGKKRRKLFEAWDAADPVDAWEFERTQRIAGIRNVNPLWGRRVRAGRAPSNNDRLLVLAEDRLQDRNFSDHQACLNSLDDNAHQICIGTSTLDEPTLMALEDAFLPEVATRGPVPPARRAGST